MELTEKERLMLVDLKKDILKLTLEIMDITKEKGKKLDVKKKLTTNRANQALSGRTKS